MIRNRKEKILNGSKFIFWAIFPVILGISLVSLATFVFGNIDYAKMWTPKDNLATVVESFTGNKTKEEEKSKYFYLNNADEEPKVSAKAYLVGDLNTGEVILSKNQEKKFPIASISKLMTALVASEIAKEDDIAQVSKKALATKGTNGNFTTGQKIKVNDLLYPLLLESSNDAAEIIAEHFERNVFIQKMNQQAEILKMLETSYEDPSGLSPKNQSTVSDTFKLTGYLNQKKQELLKITTMRSYSNKKQSWSNISKFLNKDGYMGGKSGYTDPAKQTVVSLFSLPLSKSGVPAKNK